MTHKATLVIDQGTSSTRVMLFSKEGEVIAKAQRELAQQYPQPGWVEQDPCQIIKDVIQLTQQVVEQLDNSWNNIDSLGITNQRETVVVWDCVTGEPIAPAIVWLDRRTSAACEEMARMGYETTVRERTGLLLARISQCATVMRLRSVLKMLERMAILSGGVAALR